MSNDEARVVLLGLDALDSRILKYMVKSRMMPQFDDLFNEGRMRLRELSSWKSERFNHPNTAQAWPCIYCGGGVDFHGVDTSFTRNQTTVDFTKEVPSTIFDDMSHAGLTVASYAMPVTWPARDIKGWMVSGFPSGTGDSEVAESEVWGLEIDDLRDDWGDLKDDAVRYEQTDRSAMRFMEAEDERWKSMRHTISETGIDADVVCYGTQFVDRLGHHFEGPDYDGKLHNEALIRLAYEKVDHHIERAITEFGADVVVGISDHGFDIEANNHSMHPVAFEYTTDDELQVDSFEEMDDITDFRDYWCELLGIERCGKHERYTSSRDEVEEFTDEEMDAMEDKLSELGYM